MDEALEGAGLGVWRRNTLPKMESGIWRKEVFAAVGEVGCEGEWWWSAFNIMSSAMVLPMGAGAMHECE